MLIAKQKTFPIQPCCVFALKRSLHFKSHSELFFHLLKRDDFNRVDFCSFSIFNLYKRRKHFFMATIRDAIFFYTIANCPLFVESRLCAVGRERKEKSTSIVFVSALVVQYIQICCLKLDALLTWQALQDKWTMRKGKNKIYSHQQLTKCHAIDGLIKMMHCMWNYTALCYYGALIEHKSFKILE